MTKLPYGPHEQQFGHLYLPAATGRRPVAVVVHGGFWRAKYDLGRITPLCEALAAEGFAVWNLEYRRIGNGGGWPVTFDDVARGARFVHELATSYPVDASKTIAVGHSAGGHLALLLGTAGLVGGVVSLAGVADLRRASELGLSNGVVEEFLGLGGEFFSDASPIERLPVQVPVALIHGLADDIVPHEISARYADAARRSGSNAELISLPDTGHFEVIDPKSAQWPAVLRQIERISAMVCSSSSSVE